MIERLDYAKAEIYPLGGRKIVVYGGPYLAKPTAFYGVKLAAEIRAECDEDFGCRDFGTWPADELEESLARTIAVIKSGRPVYIGCMAGRGRTGTYIAALYRVLDGREDPVSWTRANYNPHAVETLQQERLVRSFNVRRVRDRVNSASEGPSRAGFFESMRRLWSGLWAKG